MNLRALLNGHAFLPGMVAWYRFPGANGITPYRMSGGKGGMGCNTLAESGTNQLELNFLAQITNNPSYGQKSATFYPYMDRY